MTATPKTIMTIPSGFAFLPKLAETLLADPRLGGAFDKKFALDDFTILLPHRRAVQALKTALLQQAKTDALLMPDIRPIGEADEGALLFSDSAAALFDMPPCIGDLARQNLLTTLVLKWGLRDGRLTNPAQAAKLASELMVFLDQAATEEISLDKMQNKDGAFVPQDFSTHWQQSLDFLDIIISAWPEIKKEMQVIEPPEARRHILQQQTDLLREQNADHARPIIAAGSTGSIPATARLLDAVAGAAYGAVVLPALDMEMDEAAWDALADTPSHPQAGLFGLLKQFNVPRKQVTLWPACAGADSQADRRRFLSAALLPAEQTGQWAAQITQDDFDVNKALDGLTLLTGDDMWHEAGLIGLVLREVLATPNKTAILVTPNRQLARHVAAQMRQWGVDIDDTAGQSLAQAPAGRFVRLVLETWAADFAPIDLLAVLKHDAAHCGADRAAHLAAVQGLDIFLRGKGVLTSLDDLLILAQADERGEKLRPFIENLMQHFAPLIDLPAQMGFGEMAAALVQVCENLTRDAAGVARIWQGADGRALEKFLAALGALDSAPPPKMNRHDWVGLLTHWLATAPPVRRPYGQHPRLAIMGLLEARLVQADVMILGGLNEGVWPSVPDTGPWVSRPMRAALGMTAPERSIGQAAHDFVQAACAPCVILTRPRKQDGSPTVAARWLTRMEAIVKGRLGAGAALPSAARILHYWQARHVADAEAAQAQSENENEWLGAYHRPLPCPPARVRPRKISVTQIQTLQNNPYAIYARHVLGLKRLDDLHIDASAAARGSFVHHVLEDFVAQYPDALPKNTPEILQKMARDLAQKMAGGEDVLRFWWARFVALSQWFADFERERRARIEKIWPEQQGAITFKIGQQDFTLTGRADRIELHKDGRLHILDYKTGMPPTQADVATHRDMQMTLLGQIATQGGFDTIAAAALGGLAYVQTHGGFPAGQMQEIRPPKEMDDIEELSQEAMEELHALLKFYANGKTPYAPHLGAVRYDDYAHLARVLEWSAGAEGEEV